MEQSLPEPLADSTALTPDVFPPLEAAGITDEPASERLDSASTEYSPVRSSKKEGWLAVATAGGYLLFWPLVRRIPSASLPIVALTTMLSLLLVLHFTVRIARAIRSPFALGVNLIAAGAVVLPSILIPLLGQMTPAWPGWAGIIPFWKSYLQFFRSINGLHTLALIWLAAALGVLISRLVREVKLLLPMGVTLAMVDMYAVFGGGIVAVAESGKNSLAHTAMSALTVQLPTTQPKSGAAPFPLLVGFADFLFIALFFACFSRFKIPGRRTFLVLYTVLFLYMGLVFLFGWALPALVPIAVVVIGMNLRQFRYVREEAFALLYAGLILAAALSYLVYRSRH